MTSSLSLLIIILHDKLKFTPDEGLHLLSSHLILTSRIILSYENTTSWLYPLNYTCSSSPGFVLPLAPRVPDVAVSLHPDSSVYESLPFRVTIEAGSGCSLSRSRASADLALTVHHSPDNSQQSAHQGSSTVSAHGRI